MARRSALIGFDLPSLDLLDWRLVPGRGSTDVDLRAEYRPLNSITEHPGRNN